MVRTTILLVLALAATARGFDSVCFDGPDPCSDGPGSAQKRWIGALDEHRQIWESTVRLSGLPSGAWDASPFTLRTFAGEKNEDGTDRMVSVSGELVPSVAPVDFAEARRAIDRPGPATIGEFAQLPDFSYALWDWASGNETCPLEIGSPTPTDPVTCHDFKFHMGPVNSNHFLPQAEKFWAHYHGLAMQRAQACNTLEMRLGADRDRFRPLLRTCEREALILEAVSHHFLQDAWSMGHMWERWGSPDPADFAANMKGGIFVGLITGIIHGARSVAQSILGHINADVNDPMCAPAGGVDFRLPPAIDLHPGIGDEYLGALGSDPAFDEQNAQLTRCAVSSIRQVYSQLSAPELGPMIAPAAGTCCVDPAEACFGQRATNTALLQGAGIDFHFPGGPQRRIELSPELAVGLLLKASNDGIPECHGTDAVYSVACRAAIAGTLADLAEVVATLRVLAAEDPSGVAAASGGLGVIGGLARNAAYLDRTPLYLDPALPWPNGGATLDPRTAALARTFHEGHAGDWCARMNNAYLRKLKQHVLDAADAAPPQPEELAAATEACTTFAARHVRAFTSGGSQTGGEPLCKFAADDPSHVAYVDRLVPAGGTQTSAAASWCTCGDGQLDSGEACDGTDDEACPGHCAPPFHTQRVGSTCVLDECTCLPEGDVEACNQIAFVREDGCEIGCSTTGDIWVASPGGGGEHAITSFLSPVYVAGPRWSPDGRQLAYRVIEQSDTTKLKVVVHTLSTGQEEVVSTIGALGYMTSIPEGPTWSPDGTKIAVEGIYGIHTIDLANNNFMTWLAAPAHYYAPDWSPEGTTIAVRTGPTIGIMPAGGGAAVPFVSSQIIDPFDHKYHWRPAMGAPRFSPDGQRLVFTADYGARIAIIPAAATGTVRLLHPDPLGLDPMDFTKITYADPTWSPDGTRILFSMAMYDSSRPLGVQRNDDLWSMADDGGDIQRVTSTGWYDAVSPAFLESGPDW